MALDKNLQKLNKLLSLMDEDSLTKEDFIASFEKVVEFIKKMQEQNLEEVEQLKKAFESVSNQLKENNNLDLQDVKAEISKQITSALKEQQDGMNFIHDKVSKLKDGQDADEEHVINAVLDRIEFPEQEKVDMTSVETALEEIQDKLEELEKTKDEIESLKKRPVGGGIVGRDIIKDLDISDQLDGVTKTFNIQAVWNIISVDLSSFPYGSLRKGVDFTWTPTSITFTDEITAATQLAAGQSCVLTVVQG